MISLFHILVYVFFAYAMCVYAKKSEYLEHAPEKLDRYLWFYILFFTLVCALRGRTGVDTLSYVHMFKQGWQDLSSVNGEWGFYYLCEVISKSRIHFSVGLGICSFIQIFFTVKGILPHKYLLIYFPIVLFGGSLFLGMCNAIAQMMAAAMFFYAAKFIVQRKPVFYALFIGGASLFHHSALILLPLYFIPVRFDVSSRRMILLIVYVTCFVLGSRPQFQGLIGNLEYLIDSSGYDHYVDTASKILDPTYTKEAREFGPMQLSYFLCGLAVIWYGPMLKDRYSASITTFKLWYLFAVAYGCLYFLVCNVSHLMIRPIMYLHTFQAIILSMILYELFKQGQKDRAKKQMGQILLFIIWINIIWEVIKSTGSPNECTTYKLFFL